MEDSLSNGSYVPEFKAKKIKFGDFFRHEPVGRIDVTPKNNKRRGMMTFAGDSSTPQVSVNFQEKRASGQTGFRGTDSVETIEKSERTVKTIRPYVSQKSSDPSPGPQLVGTPSNPFLKRKSQAFNINSAKPVHNPMRRELFVAPKLPAQMPVLSRATSNPKPVVKMAKKDKTEIYRVISEIDSYKADIEKAKQPAYHYSEAINLKKHRVNVQEAGLCKIKTKRLLSNFAFEKKERVVGNIKDKIGKNKKIIQYEAKALKSTNSQDINNFRTQLKLIHLEGKNDYFFVELSKINQIHKERMQTFQPPPFKSGSIFTNYPLYSNCKVYFYMAVSRRRLSAISDIYLYSKYKKNEPKMISKHIEKSLMLPIYNLVKTADFMKPFRSPLTIEAFDLNKSYKSKSIFCGNSLYYTVLANPKATAEQLQSSYSFKLRYNQDDQASMQEDEANILKISGVVIRGSYDCEEQDREKAQPKAIFLDKNTLMNLLLQRFEYDNDSFNTLKRNRSKGIVLDKGFNAEEEIKKDKSNFVLTKIDLMLDKLNLKARQHSMVHFHISNMTEYKDFFQRTAVVGSKKQLSPSAKKDAEILYLQDPFNPSSNNMLFRDIAASKSRETGSEKNISTNKKPGRLMRDQFKITVNNPAMATNQPNPNDSQTSNAATVQQRTGLNLMSSIHSRRMEQKEAGFKQEESQHNTANYQNSRPSDKTQEKLKPYKKLEDDEALDKISHIPLNDKVEDVSPSMRSGMSIYEGEEDLNSPKLRMNRNFLQIQENKRFQRSKSNHIDQYDEPEDHKSHSRNRNSPKLFER